MAAAGDRADFARFLQHAAAAINLLPALIHIYKADGGILTIARGRGWAGAEGRALAARARERFHAADSRRSSARAGALPSGRLLRGVRWRHRGSIPRKS